MSKHLSDFIESVNTALFTHAFQTRPLREEIAQYREQMAKTRRAGAPPMLPPKYPSAEYFAEQAQKGRTTKLLSAGYRTAAAIFDAESIYASTCLQLLADGGATSTAEVLEMRAAGDAVLRFAGAALRGQGFHDDHQPTQLSRLIAMAETTPGSDTVEESRRRSGPNHLVQRAFMDPAPRLVPSACASAI